MHCKEKEGGKKGMHFALGQFHVFPFGQDSHFFFADSPQRGSFPVFKLGALAFSHRTSNHYHKRGNALSFSGLKEISGDIKALAGLAREGKLTPEQYTGGTFTISNLGCASDARLSLPSPLAQIYCIGSTILELQPSRLD